MNTSISWPVLLCVRGTMLPSTQEEMRVLHNQTAGSAQGIAAARALGDLSHVVYSPVPSGKNSKAKAGELLFLDVWVDPKGIMEFFANEQVVQQGTKLFSSRDASVWMPAPGAFSYHLPAPRSKKERFLGMVRGPIASPDESIAMFREADIKAQPDARRRGLVSHEIYLKMNPPGDSSPLELLGLDLWSDSAGMGEHYSDPNHGGALRQAISGPPEPTIWQPAAGDWSEW